ncbi:MAG: hypothetical protein M3323_07905 [Actinomycetota bacterium]|nr:hypothetical protein [Actinomycetota bacterium]
MAAAMNPMPRSCVNPVPDSTTLAASCFSTVAILSLIRRISAMRSRMRSARTERSLRNMTIAVWRLLFVVSFGIRTS